MADYIEREQCIRTVCKACNMQQGDEPCEPNDCVIRERLMEMPAAEVEPVRHGHWIDCEDEYSSYVRCSECGDEFTCWEADCAHTDFCPGCGADMRGADNG